MATYVQSPSTQSGVDSTRTSISRNFTSFAGGFIRVDYTTDTETDFDVLRLYWNGSNVGEFSGASSGSANIDTASAGSFALKIEFEKDGGVGVGSDLVTVSEIRVYNSSSVLQSTYTFTASEAPPSGWTEVLNDGGTTVVGSHWETLSTGGGGVTGTIASTTTRPTFAASGKQTHVGAIAATTTAPTFAASGAQTHLGVLGATTTTPTFAGSGTVGTSGVTATLASTTTAPTFAGSGAQTHVGAVAVTTSSPTFAALGVQTHLGVLAATTAMPGFYAEGTQAETLPPSAEGVALRNAGPSRAGLGGDGCRARIEADRGTSARVRPTTSYNAEFSEG